MKQETLGELTEALESVGFELVSFKEELHKDLSTGFSTAFTTVETAPPKLLDATGIVTIVAKRLQP
jgi:hypothetical protein